MDEIQGVLVRTGIKSDLDFVPVFFAVKKIRNIEKKY